MYQYPCHGTNLFEFMITHTHTHCRIMHSFSWNLKPRILDGYSLISWIFNNHRFNCFCNSGFSTTEEGLYGQNGWSRVHSINTLFFLCSYLLNMFIHFLDWDWWRFLIRGIHHQDTVFSQLFYLLFCSSPRSLVFFQILLSDNFILFLIFIILFMIFTGKLLLF